jgi:hypothetical protein
MRLETPESLDLLKFGYERGLQERAPMQCGCETLLAYFMWGYFTLLIAIAAFALGHYSRMRKWRWPWTHEIDHRRESPVTVEEEIYGLARHHNVEKICGTPSPVSRAPSVGNSIATDGLMECARGACSDDGQCEVRRRPASDASLLAH